MKKNFVLGALLFAALPVLACDQCGCGLLLGVQPYDHATNFGLQWRMRYLEGTVHVPGTASLLKHGGHAEGPVDRQATYVETYSVLEARGEFWFGQRTSLMASFPVLNNFQAVDGVRSADTYGLGDPILLARHAVLGSTCGPDPTRLRHRFTIGLGLKLPLGRTDVVQYGRLLDHDLQPGTGTWDGLLSLEYMVRGTRWGTSLGVMGRYNGVMADGYRMGHSAALTAEVFRIIPLHDFKLIPSFGGYLESALPDRMDHVADPTTGGSTLFSHAGARLWWKNLGLSFTWQQALLNDLGSLMIPNRERFVAGITYNFEKD